MRALTTTEKEQVGRALPIGGTMGNRIGKMEQAGYLHLQTWDAPAAAAAAAIHAAVTLANGATTTVTTLITNPDFPRYLSITGAMSGGSLTGNVIIYGTNIEDQAISDTIALNNNSTVAGVAAFKSVTSIVLPARVTAGDTVSIGITDQLGANILLTRNTVLLTFVDGSKEGTAPTVTTDADEIEKCSFDTNTALNGAKDVEIVYLDINDRL